MDLSLYFRSVLEQDTAAIVICNLRHEIIYMNPAACARYARYGGSALLGSSLLACHSPQSAERIRQVVDWFAADPAHQLLFTGHHAKDNMDVYMIALRGEGGALIGYYEKHAHRTAETAAPYAF